MFRRIFLSLSACLLLGLPARAEFQTATEAVTQLKTYGPTYFAEARDVAIRNEVSKDHPGEDEESAGGNDIDRLDAAYSDLQSAVSLLLKEKKWDALLLAETVRVASLSLDNDPTWFAGEILLPLYKKDKKTLLEAVKKLPPQNAKDLQESLQDSAREKKKGNG